MRGQHARLTPWFPHRVLAEIRSQRLGVADPRRRRERGLKPMAANALDKVRNAVCKKQSANELREVNVPGHLGSLS